MKNVEKAREIRLWIGQVIVPAIIGGTILWSNPNVRCFIHNKFNNIKTKFNNVKFKIIKKQESE